MLEILRNYDAKWIVRGLKWKKTCEGESHGYLLRQTTNSQKHPRQTCGFELITRVVAQYILNVIKVPVPGIVNI